MLAEALEANRQLSELADGLIEDNALLREQVAWLVERDAERDAELAPDCFAVLQRMLFGRSSEKSRPEPPVGGDDNAAGGGGQDRELRGGTGKEARPGGRGRGGGLPALPRLEVFWDFPDGGYCCPGVRGAVHAAGGLLSGEQLDWQVIVRLVAPLPPPLPAGLRLQGARHGDGARPAEGDRQGPVHQRVHRDVAD